MKALVGIQNTGLINNLFKLLIGLKPVVITSSSTPANASSRRECFEKTRILPSKASRNCNQIRVYALGVSLHTPSLCRFAVFEYNPTSLYASPIQAPPLLKARIA